MQLELLSTSCPELIMVAEIFKEVMNILEPLIMREKAGLKPIGRAVARTIEGDLHDIGKNLFIVFLRSMSFEVIDLGIDVSAKNLLILLNSINPIYLL